MVLTTQSLLGPGFGEDTSIAMTGRCKLDFIDATKAPFRTEVFKTHRGMQRIPQSVMVISL